METDITDFVDLFDFVDLIDFVDFVDFGKMQKIENKINQIIIQMKEVEKDIHDYQHELHDIMNDYQIDSFELLEKETFVQNYSKNLNESEARKHFRDWYLLAKRSPMRFLHRLADQYE